MITYHTLKKGETPSSLAKRFTGDASRYTDLLPCNKGLKQGTDGRTGAPAFHSCDWQAGTRISIPSSWTTEGTIGRVPVADKAWTPMTERLDNNQWKRSIDHTMTPVGPENLDTWQVGQPMRKYWIERIEAWLQIGFPGSLRCMKWNKEFRGIKIGAFVDHYINAYGVDKFSSIFYNKMTYSKNTSKNIGGPSLFFYSDNDRFASFIAARTFADAVCTPVTASYSKNTGAGPTFTLGYPGLIGAGESTSTGAAVTGDSTKEVADFGDRGGQTCFGGAAVTEFKPYFYVVQSEDLNEFYKVPAKFGMPIETKYWQQLRDANQNRRLKTVVFQDNNGKDVTSCVIAGLQAGQRLRVPASWGEPKEGIEVVYPKDDKFCPEGKSYYGGECIDNDKVPKQPGLTDVSLTDGDSTSTWLALLAVAGLAAVGGVYLYKQRNKR